MRDHRRHEVVRRLCTIEKRVDRRLLKALVDGALAELAHLKHGELRAQRLAEGGDPLGYCGAGDVGWRRALEAPAARTRGYGSRPLPDR